MQGKASYDSLAHEDNCNKDTTLQQPNAHTPLEELRKKQAALLGIASALSRSSDPNVDLFFEETMQHVAQASSAPMVCIHLAEGQPGRLNMVAGLGLDPVWARAWSRLKISGTTPPALAMRRGKACHLSGSQAPAGLSGVFAVPITGVEVAVGTLSLLWPGQHAMPADADLGPFLETTGNLLGIAIEHAGMVSHMVDRYNEVLDLKHHLEERNKELADLNYRLSELSVTDSLTGLYNRRYLQERLSQEVDRSVRLGQPLTIIMADLDHFKRINDELGHQQGDEALVRFAGWFRSGVRRVDTVGRYGGEEFLALLVNCNGEDGERVANKIRMNTWKLSAAHPFDVMGGFTVSMGVAQLGPGQDPVTLVARADRALYQAKQEGRNRVSRDNS